MEHNYAEIVESLNRIADAGLSLKITPRRKSGNGANVNLN